MQTQKGRAGSPLHAALTSGHHGISLRSRRNLPVRSCGASLASHTIVSAPSCTDRVAFAPPLCDQPLHSAHLQTRETLWLRAVAPLRAQSLCSLLLPKPSSCLIHRVRPHSRFAKNPSATAADSRVIPPLFGAVL